MSQEEEITPLQSRLLRLLESRDFREVLLEWMDIAQPWAGIVQPEHASEVSYANGRASFISDLMNDIKKWMPEQYASLLIERNEHVRSELARQLRQGERESAGADRQQRLRGYRERTEPGFDADR